MEGIMTAQRDKMDRMMERVRNLLAIAEHPNTGPAEAAVARSQADALMFRHKIDVITDAEEKDLVTPVWASVLVCRKDSEFNRFYADLFRTILEHTGCRGYMKVMWHRTPGDDAERSWWGYEIVGLETDVEYAQMLWLSAQMAFGRALEPTFHHEETHAQNALRLRQGGMERHRIARLLFGDSTTVNEQKAKNRKVTALIKAEAARIGEPELVDELLGRSNNIKTYRISYANGFWGMLKSRLRDAATQRGLDSEGTLVLASWANRVDEAFYERFPPPLRPQPATTPVIGEVQEECPKCKKAASGYCRDHQWKKPSTAKASAQRFSRAAWKAGNEAAKNVDLGPTKKHLGA